MSKYTYYVFVQPTGERDVVPMLRGKRANTDAQADQYGIDNDIYMYSIGPFRTRRGADFMAAYGANNPHCQCVADAERLAKAQ